MQKIKKEIQMSKPNPQDLQIAFMKETFRKKYELHKEDFHPLKKL